MNDAPHFISAELRMFRKFDEKESISAVSQLKTSVQKGIRNQVNILRISGQKARILECTTLVYSREIPQSTKKGNRKKIENSEFLFYPGQEPFSESRESNGKNGFCKFEVSTIEKTI